MKLFKRHQLGVDFDPDIFRHQYAAEAQELQLPVSETRFLGKYIGEKKLHILLIACIVFFGILLGRSFQLQIVRGAYYAQLADTNRIRITPLPAPRGLIFDSAQRQLVSNIPIFDARVTPVELPLLEVDRSATIGAIARITGVDEYDIRDRLSTYPRNYKYPITIAENVPYEQALLMTISSAEVPALTIETRHRREYVDTSFSHLLGYEGKITQEELRVNTNRHYLFTDRIGKTGLESYYEQSLRGSYGFVESEVNARGEVEKVLARQEPINGTNLILSIDSVVQDKIHDILQSHLRRRGLSRASVVMLDPRNGEVRALVSLPDYDNNLFARGITSAEYTSLIENPHKPLFDRSIRGEYPSGSTIKPVVAAAALQEGIISDRTTIQSSGGIWIQGRWFFPDWATGGHGPTNVYRAIAWSVNTFFYMIGGGYGDFVGLGLDALIRHYTRAGLGAPTGIDLPGEARGLVPTAEWKQRVMGEEWYIGDTYHIAIGQGHLLATPIQIANFTSIFANGGTLYQPHLVTSLQKPNGTLEKISPTSTRDGVFDPAFIRIVRTGMRQTVTNGSAQLLNTLPVTSAGKTGTAQWSSSKQTHAWYVGFAPYEQPEVSFVILVEEGGEGSQTAVPIARDILEWYFGEYANSLH